MELEYTIKDLLSISSHLEKLLESPHINQTTKSGLSIQRQIIDKTILDLYSFDQQLQDLLFEHYKEIRKLSMMIKSKDEKLKQGAQIYV